MPYSVDNSDLGLGNQAPNPKSTGLNGATPPQNVATPTGSAYQSMDPGRFKQAALEAARRGHPVFPVAPGKASPPLVNNWPAQATVDETQIERWWAEWPEANPAVHVGGANLVTVDLDVKGDKEGILNFSTLEFGEDPTPDTFKVKTPSGGEHLYFTAPEGVTLSNSVERLADGVDIRAGNGYVVAPGAETAQGRYTILGSRPPAPLPAWIAKRAAARVERTSGESALPVVELDHPHAIEKAKSYLANRIAENKVSVEGEGGDERAYKTAARLRSIGVTEDTAFDLLVKSGWNAACRPPWSGDELREKVRNGYEYAQNAPGTDLAYLAPGGGMEVAAEQAREANVKARVKALTGDLDVTLAQSVSAVQAVRSGSPFGSAGSTNGGSGGTRHNEWTPLTLEELCSMPPLKWTVDGFLPENAIAMLYGPFDSYKSFLSLDVCLRIACGMDVHGMAVDGPHRVLYVAGEGGPGLQKRIKAWCAHHDNPMPENFRVIPGKVPQFGNLDTVRQFVDGIAPFNPDIVVFDTLATGLGGLNENSAQDITNVMDVFRELRNNLNTSILFVHHAGKDDSKGFRGSYDLGASADTIIRTRKSTASKLCQFTVEKQKDGEKWERFMKLQGRGVRYGEGEGEGSLVFDYVGFDKEVPSNKEMLADYKGDPEAMGREAEEARRQAEDKLTKRHERILAELTNLIDANGTEIPHPANPNGDVAVRVIDRNVLCKRLLDLGDDNLLKGDFRNANRTLGKLLRDLKDAGYIDAEAVRGRAEGTKQARPLSLAEHRKNVPLWLPPDPGDEPEIEL